MNNSSGIQSGIQVLDIFGIVLLTLVFGAIWALISHDAFNATKTPSCTQYCERCEKKKLLLEEQEAIEREERACR